jgi:hypothetical protein
MGAADRLDSVGTGHGLDPGVERMIRTGSVGKAFDDQTVIVVLQVGGVEKPLIEGNCGTLLWDALQEVCDVLGSVQN